MCIAGGSAATSRVTDRDRDVPRPFGGSGGAVYESGMGVMFDLSRGVRSLSVMSAAEPVWLSRYSIMLIDRQTMFMSKTH